MKEARVDEMRCPDGGWCHHACEVRCWRVRRCLPLSASGWEQWPLEIMVEHAMPAERARVEDVLVGSLDLGELRLCRGGVPACDRDTL